jgi:hypothetical protein
MIICEQISQIERTSTKHGEVFTPDFLVERMLKMTPENVWDDPNKTFLEPSCGNGNFIIAIIRKKIRHGSTIEQAIQTTFGVDILEDNIQECRQRVFDEFLWWLSDSEPLKKIIEENIICKNFLKE